MSQQVKKPLIIGHRGAYDEAPENSLKGFKKAIELGADYIEFDVHESQDGALVVIHNIDILRRMGINRSIDQMKLKELKKLDLGEGECVPELWEVIKLAKGKIKLLCEIKAQGISKKVINLLKDEEVIDTTIIQSFLIDELLEVRKIEPHLELAAIVPFNENFIPEWDKRKKMVQDVITLNFPIVVTRHKNVDKDLIEYSHKRNLKVFTYTINTMRTMIKMIEIGVDGIIVNSISKAKKLFNKKMKKK
ncbi:MAG: glycerophosphodiester phosphodiesterase [Candidatus Hermodarchaeota archaeon]